MKQTDKENLAEVGFEPTNPRGRWFESHFRQIVFAKIVYRKTNVRFCHVLKYSEMFKI